MAKKKEAPKEEKKLFYGFCDSSNCSDFKMIEGISFTSPTGKTMVPYCCHNTMISFGCLGGCPKNGNY